jgi:hypothetical protein
MNRAAALSVYRLILRIHPAPFVARFGDEMLWIFEEECQRGATTRLLFDGILSLLRQRFRVQEEPAHASAGFVVLVSDSRMSLVRLFQGWVMSSLLFAGFALLLNQGGPFPVAFRGIPAPNCMPCDLPPPASPPIEMFPKTLR